MKAALIATAAVAMFAAGQQSGQALIDAQRLQAEAATTRMAAEAHLPIDFAQSIAALQ